MQRDRGAEIRVTRAIPRDNSTEALQAVTKATLALTTVFTDCIINRQRCCAILLVSEQAS